MAFTISAFCQTRPYLFHLTSIRNLELIRSRSTLVSAAALMREAGNEQWLRSLRRGSKQLTLPNDLTVLLRDQDPLHPGNVELRDGWTWPIYLNELNSRVFFWPGTESGPVTAGRNHFQRYEAEDPAVLRVSTAELFRENPNSSPEFTKYNTGAPRCHDGLPSPRGPETFQGSHLASFTPSGVVEVTFRDIALLPRDMAMWRRLSRESWEDL